ECGDAALYRERPLLGGSGRRCSAHRFTSLSTAAFPMVVILDISKLKSSNSDLTHATPDSDDGDSGKYLYEGHDADGGLRFPATAGQRSPRAGIGLTDESLCPASAASAPALRGSRARAARR